MQVEFTLPDVGEGVAEAELIRWLVREGESVEADQPLAEVQTDKAVVELPSPAAGRVLALHGKEGDTIPVGSLLVVIGEGETEDGGRRLSHRRKRMLAAPSTRRLARELGVDLTQVEGTGPQGRVMDEDVRRFAAGYGATDREAVPQIAATQVAEPNSSPTVSAVEADETAYTEEPLTSIRRVIAERLSFSVTRKPHATHFDTLDVSGVVQWRERLKSAGGQSPGYLPVLLKMIAIALRRHPVLNAHYDEERGVVRTFSPVHVGVAVDTPRGLLVPVIRHVEEKSIRQLSDELRGKTESARKGTLSPEEMGGGTFTVSNAGPLGGHWATPIIHPPEVAILAIHPVEQRPVVENGNLTVGWRMNVSLSFDHRVLDGGEAIRFTRTLQSYTACLDELVMDLT